MQAEEFDSKQAHVHCAKASWKERIEARTYFETLAGSESFSRFEKPKKANADAEPKFV